MDSAHPNQAQSGRHLPEISPFSTHQTPIDDEKQLIESTLESLPRQSISDGKQSVNCSPVEKVAYFPDDKVCVVELAGITENQNYNNNVPVSEVITPNYSGVQLPAREPVRSFWRRHLWHIAVLVFALAIVGVVVGVVTRHLKKTSQPVAVLNNTLHSVATTGLFLKDGVTWNMATFWQNTTGAINLQLSLNGATWQAAKAVKLTIPPKIGSPLSATAEQDSTTGVIMVDCPAKQTQATW